MSVRVCVGGTFNRIHQGHLALLSRAFAEGDEVLVGLTGDAMAAGGRDVPVKPFGERKAALESALARLSGGKPFKVVEINDEFGPALDGDFDAIVVSEETEPAARRLNAARESAGLRPLRVAVVAMVLDGGERISSTRILGKQAQQDNT